MPLYRRLPKRGFNPIKSKGVAIMNLGTIQSLINSKKINSTDKINLELLKKLRLISQKYSKYKILGNGEIKDKINIEVDFISKSVKDKLDKTGSTITLKK